MHAGSVMRAHGISGGQPRAAAGPRAQDQAARQRRQPFAHAFQAQPAAARASARPSAIILDHNADCAILRR